MTLQGVEGQESGRSFARTASNRGGSEPIPTIVIIAGDESPTVRYSLPVNETISHFKILRKLGSGGSAEVFLAEDLHLHRKIALKLLHRHLTQDQEKLGRFQQEARWASLLNHPNVITIHEVGESNGVHFIATEYVEGPTLRSKVPHETPIEEIVDIAIGVANALVAAHEAWIVHRDIKPENIMVRPDGLVKVLDFGVAKLTQDLGNSRRVATQPKMLLGTIQYMAPEQLRGQGVDPRTDIFGLGSVIYEMVAGTPAFSGDTWIELMNAVLDDEPAPLDTHRPGVPAELIAIVHRCLEKDPDRRHKSAGELLWQLRDLRGELDFHARLNRLSSEPKS